MSLADVVVTIDADTLEACRKFAAAAKAATDMIAEIAELARWWAQPATPRLSPAQEFERRYAKQRANYYRRVKKGRR